MIDVIASILPKPLQETKLGASLSLVHHPPLSFLSLAVQNIVHTWGEPGNKAGEVELVNNDWHTMGQIVVPTMFLCGRVTFLFNVACMVKL